VCHLSVEFCENRFSGFPAADKQTNADENITLAEVISRPN